MTDKVRTLTKSFVDTRSLVFWSIVALSIYGAMHLYPVLEQSLVTYPGVGLVSTLIWLLYGLVFAVILYKLELFDRRSPMTMLGAFLWGALVVAGISVIAAPPMHDLVAKLLPESMADWTSAFAAPLTEEPLKMLGVVALAFIPGARINAAIDGLYFGIVVGLGFEVTESLLYTVQGAIKEGGSMNMVIVTFILRGVIGGLWNHPTYSAITGAGVGYFFGSTASLVKRWAAMLGALVIAMVLHGFFDSPLFEGGNVFMASIIKGLPALALLVVLYRMAQGKERRRFGAVASSEVPSELISGAELEVLSSRRARKKARKAARKSGGFAAKHAMKRLQVRQTELVAAITEDGSESERASEAASEVREAKDVLVEVGG